MDTDIILLLSVSGAILCVYAVYKILQHRQKIRFKLIEEAGNGHIPSIQKIGEKRYQIAIPQLVKALQHPEEASRRAALQALDKLGWTPPDIQTAMLCEYCRADLKAFFDRGKPALDMLLTDMISGEKHIRRRAAETMVQWIKQADIDPEIKQRILFEKQVITEKHTDGYQTHRDSGLHSDQKYSSDCTDHHDLYKEKHTDTPAGHADTGIGINWPL